MLDLRLNLEQQALGLGRFRRPLELARLGPGARCEPCERYQRGADDRFLELHHEVLTSITRYASTARSDETKLLSFR